MIANPEIGRRCFLIIDIHEVLLPAPVVIVAAEGGEFVVRWDIGEGYFDFYEGVTLEELYDTEQEAAAVIRAQRGLE